MVVRTKVLTASPNPDDVVIPKDATGEVIGSGYTHDDGHDYIAVDFGNVIADVRAVDLEVIPENQICSVCGQQIEHHPSGMCDSCETQSAFDKAHEEEK